jgi:hypothetical protein
MTETRAGKVCYSFLIICVVFMILGLFMILIGVSSEDNKPVNFGLGLLIPSILVALPVLIFLKIQPNRESDF